MKTKHPPITYKHSVNLGDLYSLLPSFKEIHKKYGRNAKIYQRLNMAGDYYTGAVHPTTHNGVQVTMNQKMFDMAKPLIEYQSYIESFDVFKGQSIDIDFDKMRSMFINMPNGSINRWCYYLFPDMATDLSKKWLEVPKKVDPRTKGKIVLNFTERYRNHSITYFFLKEYLPHLIFTGTKGEYELFTKEWELDIPYLEVNDFLELAVCINSCDLYLGNQSSAFQLAEGLKKPRIVEACSYAPNVIPHGDKGYDFYHQGGVEYYVKTLFNAKK